MTQTSHRSTCTNRTLSSYIGEATVSRGLEIANSRSAKRKNWQRSGTAVPLGAPSPRGTHLRRWTCKLSHCSQPEGMQLQPISKTSSSGYGYVRGWPPQDVEIQMGSSAAPPAASGAAVRWIQIGQFKYMLYKFLIFGLILNVLMTVKHNEIGSEQLDCFSKDRNRESYVPGFVF